MRRAYSPSIELRNGNVSSVYDEIDKMIRDIGDRATHAYSQRLLMHKVRVNMMFLQRLYGFAAGQRVEATTRIVNRWNLQ
jgi:hypothetical protein